MERIIPIPECKVVNLEFFRLLRQIETAIDETCGIPEKWLKPGEDRTANMYSTNYQNARDRCRRNQLFPRESK